MDKKNEYLKKFNRCILEYTNLSDDIVSEVGEEQPGADPMAASGAAPIPGADPMAAGGAAPMPGADPMAAGGAAPMPGADPMAAGGAAPVPGADPMAAGGTQDPSTVDPAGEAQKDNAPGGPITPNNTSDVETGEQDDKTESSEEYDKIDKAQDKALEKIEKLSQKFEKVFNSIESINNRLDANNNRLESLKNDIEKRNPSDEEKLSIRSVKSGPFTEKPDEYWEDKESDPMSNYSSDDDKNGVGMDKYSIKNSDIGGNVGDWSGIAKSFDDERFGLKGLLGY